MLEEFLSEAESYVRFAMFCSYLDIAKIVGFIWVRLLPWARQPVDYHPLHSFLGEHQTFKENRRLQEFDWMDGLRREFSMARETGSMETSSSK